MTLIVENGTGVANANSYVTDAEYVAYAMARGLDVGINAPAREVELIQAMDYLFSIEADFKGDRTLSTQENIYPRKCVCIRNALIANNVIPKELKNSQMEGGIAAKAQPLLINGSDQNIEKQKLETLEVSYFSGGSFQNVRLDRVENYLKPLLKNKTNMMTRV